ncbi:FGGY-family carbohydrate kinase [Corynebacterium glucuronolyticum]
MAASLGLDLQPGDVCISIGTSGVASTVSTGSVNDGTSMVTGFADATGRYLPLACTLNGAKVLDFAARILNVDHNGLSALALEGEPGAHAHGVSLLPYFDGERTPNRPDATGVFHGLNTDTSRENIARATVEGILCSMRDAMVALENATQQDTNRVLLIGGGAKSEAIRTIAPAIFGVDVLVPEPGEYVAMGAACQAAWVLSQQALPPAWATQGTPKHYKADPDADTVAHYEELRDKAERW